MTKSGKGNKNRILFGMLAVAMILAASETKTAKADEAAKLDVLLGDGESSETAAVTDGDYETVMEVSENTTLTISAESEIRALYIIWDSGNLPGEWSLKAGNETITCGTDGFLHEFVSIPEGITALEMEFKSKACICEIYAYGEGEIPESVERWKSLTKDADIMVFVPHAGDEVIDYGALLALYGGEKDLAVKVVYMCEYTTTEEKLKEHEKLASLWKLGVKYYPETGSFRNKLLSSSKQADKFYGYEKVLSYVTGCIRKYRPLIVVGPDSEGEYGNVVHMLLSQAVEEAVQNTGDETFFNASAAEYGTWDVPKTYIHKLRYKEDGTIAIDISGGIDSLLWDAMESRLTESWCGTYLTSDFILLDDSAYFGLFRTTVGTDSMGEVTEGIVTYEEQARIAAEKAEQERQRELARQKVLMDLELKRAARIGNVRFGRHLYTDLRDLADSMN